MDLSHYLASRLQEVYIDGTFIAYTNYKDSLRDVTWIEAETKIGRHNTIAALTFHINYYLEGLIQVFNGGDLTISDKFSFQCEKINSEHAWDERKDTLNNNAKIFIGLVRHFPDSKLNDAFVKEQYGNYLRNIEAVIEHSYYHLGQISLIKKLIRNAEISL